MPSRLLREGILSSDRVDLLDYPAEVFYRRLMSRVDDHGLYDARAAILRTSLYPLRVDRVREADISRWIAACEKAGLIALYEHGGKPYLQMLDTRWQARSEPKYPLPTENGCKQVKTPAPVFGDGDGDGDGDVSPPGKRAKASKRCPEGFQPGADAIASIARECPGVDVVRETAKFRDCEFKNPRSDWLAAWRNWMRKAFDDLSSKQRPAQSFRAQDEAAAAEKYRRFTGVGTDPNVIDMEQGNAPLIANG